MTGRLRRQFVERLSEPTLRRIQRIRHGESPSLKRPVTRMVERSVTPKVVDTFDGHAVRAEIVGIITAACDQAAVPYILLPGPRGSVHQVAVSAEDRPAALAAMDRALTGPGWVITPGGSAQQRARVIRIHRVLAAPGGQVLSGSEAGCDISFWTRLARDDVPRTDGEPHLLGTRVAPTHNGVVGYFTEQTWQRGTRAPSHWPFADPTPDIFEVREPIDVVYTWVDGSDPTWQERRAAYDPSAGEVHRSAMSLARFTNRDELRYSLRSVAMYASWVRTIYLVTDGQVPCWLDTTHPKIVVVDHRDIFRDHSALPVFNSHAIESQLHHIDGLAEQYLYLNDDVFFGRPVFPELFFHANGIKKFYVSRDTIDVDPPTLRDLPVMTAAKNGRALLEADFGVTVRRKLQHSAHPQLRSVLEDMEKRHPEMFEEVARSKFRHPDDLSIPSALQHYYAFALGRAVPATWDYRYQDISLPNTPRRLDDIQRSRPQAFCLNEIDTKDHQLSEQQSILAQFFGEYFPVPSPYEIRGR